MYLQKKERKKEIGERCEKLRKRENGENDKKEEN